MKRFVLITVIIFVVVICISAYIIKSEKICKAEYCNNKVKNGFSNYCEKHDSDKNSEEVDKILGSEYEANLVNDAVNKEKIIGTWNYMGNTLTITDDTIILGSNNDASSWEYEWRENNIYNLKLDKTYFYNVNFKDDNHVNFEQHFAKADGNGYNVKVIELTRVR